MDNMSSMNPNDPDVIKLTNAFVEFSEQNSDLPIKDRVILFSEYMKSDPELHDLSKRVFSKIEPGTKDKVMNTIQSMGSDSPIVYRKSTEPVGKYKSKTTNIDIKPSSGQHYVNPDAEPVGKDKSKTTNIDIKPSSGQHYVNPDAESPGKDKTKITHIDIKKSDGK